MLRMHLSRIGKTKGAFCIINENRQYDKIFIYAIRYRLKVS